MSCPFYYFCAWQGLGFTGMQFNVSQCNIMQELPGSGWDDDGDYVNNQTFGTQAYLLNQGQLLYTIPGSDPDTGPAASNLNWYPVWYVVACSD